MESCLYKDDFNKVMTEPEQYYFVKFHAFAKSTHQILKILTYACIYHNMSKDVSDQHFP